MSLDPKHPVSYVLIEEFQRRVADAICRLRDDDGPKKATVTLGITLARENGDVACGYDLKDQRSTKGEWTVPTQGTLPFAEGEASRPFQPGQPGLYAPDDDPEPEADDEA